MFRALTKSEENAVDVLVGIAGSADAVRDAIRALNNEYGRGPTMRELVRYILRVP